MIHFCPDELAAITAILTSLSLFWARGRHFAWCACDACLRAVGLRKT